MFAGEFKVVDHRHLRIDFPGIDKQTMQLILVWRANRLVTTRLVFRRRQFTAEQGADVVRIFDDFDRVWNSATPCCLSGQLRSTITHEVGQSRPNGVLMSHARCGFD